MYEAYCIKIGKTQNKIFTFIVEKNYVLSFSINVGNVISLNAICNLNINHSAAKFQNNTVFIKSSTIEQIFCNTLISLS